MGCIRICTWLGKSSSTADEHLGSLFLGVGNNPPMLIGKAVLGMVFKDLGKPPCNVLILFLFLFLLVFPEPGSGQVFVTSENQLVYYPSITYAIIGSSVIFVLVVALLALVLHHQRKRNNLMTLPVHRLQHPVLLSRLVVLDHPHHCNVTYNVNNGVQYVASQAEQNASDVGSPPSYSEALLDQR